ncbi:MAG: DUF489 family protein [Pseudomonadales bacterium]
MSEPADRGGYAALALAGVVQAAALVHDTAHGRSVSDAAREALLRTVPTRRAGDLAEVFPRPADLTMGARLAVEALSGQSRTPEVLRYGLQLVELARNLAGVPQVVEKLGRLLDEQDPDDLNEQQYSRIYQQTISTLGKRIQVTGEPAVLQQEATADRIRALLLAGVRLAWLWQQLGGRRWHLLLRRRALLLALRPFAQPDNADPDAT